MPYGSNQALPSAVRAHLPVGAQNIYRAAFNHAFKRYGKSDEARAHRIAWAAVKRSYIRGTQGMWIRKPADPSRPGRASRKHR
jgi:cation transport regulator